MQAQLEFCLLKLFPWWGKTLFVCVCLFDFHIFGAFSLWQGWLLNFGTGPTCLGWTQRKGIRGYAGGEPCCGHNYHISCVPSPHCGEESWPGAAWLEMEKGDGDEGEGMCGCCSWTGVGWECSSRQRMSCLVTGHIPEAHGYFLM